MYKPLPVEIIIYTHRMAVSLGLCPS